MTRQDYSTKLQVANIQLEKMQEKTKWVSSAIYNDDYRYAYELAEHLEEMADKLCATLRELIKLEKTLDEDEEN